MSSSAATKAGSATVTRRTALVRAPLAAFTYRSVSSGPTRRRARPAESSATAAPRQGSPGPRVHSTARVAAGASIVTVTLSPRRTVARSRSTRTGARASRSVRSGCQNAARPVAGEAATNSAAPASAIPAATASARRVSRVSARRTSGVACSTMRAARRSASANRSALAPLPLAAGATVL